MAIASTPLWLEIRTEYIDANLDKVIQYLSRGAVSHAGDPFYGETLKLLDSRVQELITQLCTADIDEDPAGYRGELEKSIKILGAFLLVKGASSDVLVREAFFFFIKTLIQLVPTSITEELVEVAIRSLTRRGVLVYGFDWTNVCNLQPEVIAHKIMNGLVFSDGFCPDTWYQNKGSLRIKDGFLEIYAVNREAAAFVKFASSLPLLGEGIVALTSPSDRIKDKDSNDIGVMDRFTMGFIGDQSQVTPSPEKGLKKYEQGDVLPVRYLGRDTGGALLVETVEGDHEYIKGTISAREQVFYFYTIEHFAKVLKIGDVFDAKLTSTTKNTFALKDTFTKSLIEDTVVTQSEIDAVLKLVNSKGLQTWWTRDGYPAYVKEQDCDDDYSLGDVATLMITGKNMNGYVYAQVERRTDAPIDEEESRRYCIEGLLYAEDAKFAKAPNRNVLSESFVRGLCRLLFAYQRTVVQASERFRILCQCRILSVLCEDQVARDYIEVSYSYLKNLVHFAEGHLENIKPLDVPPSLLEVPAIRRRKEIVEILKTYGQDSESDFLSTVIHDESRDAVVVQLAKLIQSCNRIDDVYPAVKNVIKQEITKYLAVQTEDSTDFEETSGPNLGIENSRQEFKTSFLMPPLKAEQQNQEKTIFRSLCSFLNTSEGGVLYLGVNDYGQVNGLDSELEMLERKTRGMYTGLDGYVRYITDRAKEYFDLDVRLCFRIEPAFDNRVVAIRVEPYRHGVVSFEGVPYIRNNSESVKMSQTLKRQIETKRLRQSKDSSSLVIALNEAINEEKEVILHNYSSSNSNELRDRHVEPFAFLSGNAYVWCYDLDDRTNKLFRVSRMGNVQITQEGWTMKSQHEKGKTDIFHFTGTEEIRVKVQLDQMAKNLLVEEYPDAVNELTRGVNDSWILETVCRQIYGIGRFYVGLVEHIRIIDAPELEQYAKQYFKAALGK